MSNLINFDFQSQTVRVELKNGEPLFCLTDVATILDISNANPSRFNLDEAGVHKMYISYESGKKQVTFISEPNLYRVIFRSNKAEAVKFQNWVFDEVLPSIRKTGSYTAPIAKLTDSQQKALADKVRSVCQHDRKAYSIVWKVLKDHFGVERYTQIPSADFENALAFVDSIALPSIDPNDPPLFLTVNMAREFSARIKHIYDLAELVNDCKPARLMQSRIKELHKFLYEYQQRNYPSNLPALP